MSNLPGSSQTETFIQAVGSPTLNVRTSRFSFVFVNWPTCSNTMNITFIFFNPGRMSFIEMQSFAAL